MPGSIPGAVLCSFPQQPRSRGPVTWAFRDHRPSPGDASARRHGNLAYLLEGPGPWWATGRSQVTRNLQALGPTRDEWEGEALCGLSRPLAFLRPQSPLCAGLPPGALTGHTSSEPSALGNTAGRQEEVPAPTPAPTRTSREKALSKLEKRNLAHIWPHREPHPLCTLSCQASGAAPPTEPSFPAGPTAPWSPAPSPATVCCRRCTRSRSRCRASSPRLSARTSDLGMDSDEGLWPEAERGFVACVVSVPQACVWVWCTCQCVLPVGVGVFNISPLGWPWSPGGELAPGQRAARRQLLCH